MNNKEKAMVVIKAWLNNDLSEDEIDTKLNELNVDKIQMLLLFERRQKKKNILLFISVWIGTFLIIGLACWWSKN